MSDPPEKEAFFSRPLHTQVAGARILVFDTVDSTSSRAFNSGLDGTVVIAEHQTQGRGRHGRVWHSPPGLGLWFSVAFTGGVDGLEFAAPLAVRDGLRPYGELTLKWPNDLLAGSRKICGILIERRAGITVAGIGINVRHRPEDLPPELRATAGSIYMATGQAPERSEVLQYVLTALDRRVCALRAGQGELIRREWAAACGVEGRRVRYRGVEGFVTAIDGRGGLVLDTPAGVSRVLFGEPLEWREDEACCS